MTREQVKQCEIWEANFRMAIRSNFVRMSPSDFGKVAKLYTEILGKTLSKSQMTCNTCRLRTLQELGKDFFDSRDKFIKEDAEKEKQEEQPKEEKRRGRPRKINLDAEQTEPTDADEESSESSE